MCLVPEIYAIPVLVVDLSDRNHFIKKDIAFEKIPLIISAPTIEKINKYFNTSYYQPLQT